MARKTEQTKKSDATDDVDPRYIVPGLARGLALLQLFTRERPARTLAELATGIGLTRSATYRLVYTLDKEGFIAREPEGRHYRITSKALTFGFDYLNSQGVTEIAQPFLRRLSDKASAAAYIVILDGWHAVYLARVVPPVALVSNLQIGARHPAHVTASGRIMLAHQDEERLREVFKLLKQKCRAVPPPASFDALALQAAQDRRRGHVFHASILNPGIASHAAPVRDRGGAVVAAVTLIGPEQHMHKIGGERTLKGLVGETAMAISEKIGYAGR